MHRSRVAFSALAGLVLCINESPVKGQAREVWVEGPRPVADAVDKLVEDCRCVITYEDPLWDSAEIMDVTDSVSRVKNPPRRIYVPKGVGFSFPYERPTTMSGPQDMSGAVTTMLQWYDYKGQKSQFRVEASANGLHVIPVRGSVLDVQMSVPEGEGRTTDVLASFVTELAKATKRKVSLGTVPTGHLSTSKAHISGSKEPARSVLARLLSSSGRKVYWQLFYDFTLQFYALNLTLADPVRCEVVQRGAPCDPGDTEKAVLFDGPGPQ